MRDEVIAIGVRGARFQTLYIQNNKEIDDVVAYGLQQHRLTYRISDKNKSKSLSYFPLIQVHCPS